MPPILPPFTPSTHVPDPRSRVDGCPECVTNTEAPFDGYDVAGGWVAYYLCADCGHFWKTTWGAR